MTGPARTPSLTVFEFLQNLATALYELAAENVYLAIAIWVGIEEAGVPLPLPGETAVILGGYQASRGEASLLLLALVGYGATMAGASVLYWVARLGGHPLVFRFGRFLRITPARLERAEGRMREYAPIAIMVGRLVPGLRILTTVAAGVFRVPYLTFFLATSVSTVVWLAAFLAIGWFLGDRWEEIVAQASANPWLTALAGVGVILLLILLRRQLMRRANAVVEGPVEGADAAASVASSRPGPAAEGIRPEPGPAED